MRSDVIPLVLAFAALALLSWTHVAIMSITSFDDSTDAGLSVVLDAPNTATANASSQWITADGVNLTTWWHASSRPLWQWNFEFWNRSSTRFFGMEIGFAADGHNKSDCRKEYLHKICHVRGFFPALALDDAPTVCLQKTPEPRFSFVPKRDAFTLLDAALLFNETSVRILLLGDSTTMDLVNNLLCVISRMHQVVVEDRSGFSLPGEIGSMLVYRADTTRLSVATQGRNTTVHISVLQMPKAHESSWPGFVSTFCHRHASARSHIIAFAQGLWYHDLNSSEPDDAFLADFPPLLRTMEACARNGSVVAYISPPTQHFRQPFGWYNGPVLQEMPRAPCQRIAGPSIERVDRRTRWLRERILPKTSFHMAAPPWAALASDAADGPLWQQALNASDVPLFFIPYGDLTMELHDYHHFILYPNLHTDCTHYFRHADLVVGVSDALYWAVYRSTTASASLALARTMRPLFYYDSPVVDDALIRHVNANFATVGAPLPKLSKRHVRAPGQLFEKFAALMT